MLTIAGANDKPFVFDHDDVTYIGIWQGRISIHRGADAHADSFWIHHGLEGPFALTWEPKPEPWSRRPRFRRRPVYRDSF